MTSMTQPTKLTVQAMFRQHASAAAGESSHGKRHWLMDSKSGRKVLMTALMRKDRTGDLPLFTVPASVDHLIEPFIDKLGLRDLKEPEDALSQALMELRLAYHGFRALIGMY